MQRKRVARGSTRRHISADTWLEDFDYLSLGALALYRAAVAMTREQWHAATKALQSNTIHKADVLKMDVHDQFAGIT